MTQETAQFKSDWTPCSREWFNDLAKYRSENGQHPITDAIIAADTGDSSLIFNLAQQCRKFESEHAALNAVAQCLQRRNSVMPTKESTEALATLQTLRVKEGNL